MGWFSKGKHRSDDGTTKVKKATLPKRTPGKALDKAKVAAQKEVKRQQRRKSSWW